MKVGFLSLALIVVAFAGAHSSPASAMGTALAKSQQPRNQAQAQEGLSPEKKKKISSFGPEDVFGTTGENTGNRLPRQPRKPLPTPALQSAPTQKPPVTSATAPSAQTSATPVQSSSAEPSPTVAAAAVENGLQAPSLGQGNSDKIFPKWVAPIGLIAMALVVSAALILTLTKLVEKIREGSSG